MGYMIFLKIHISHDIRARKILKAVLESWLWVLSNGYSFIAVNRRFLAVKSLWNRRLFLLLSQFFWPMHISYDFRARKMFKTVLESWFWVLSTGYYFITVNRRFLAVKPLWNRRFLILLQSFWPMHISHDLRAR